MKKKTTIVAVLAVLVVLLFTQSSNASPQRKVEFWEFYAVKETPCYFAEYDGEKWLVVFNQKLKPFARNEYISNVLVGEQTYINPCLLYTSRCV